MDRRQSHPDAPARPSKRPGPQVCLHPNTAAPNAVARLCFLDPDAGAGVRRLKHPLHVWAAAARDAGHEEGGLLVKLMHDAFTAKASAENLADSLEGSRTLKLVAKGVELPGR